MMMKKSIKDLSLSISETEYRKLGGLSYSMLASFLRAGDPASLFDDSKKESDPLRFGSLVDCLVTEPETLKERFYIKDFPSISGNIISVFIYIYDKCPDAKTFMFVPDELKLEAAEKMEYCKNLVSTTVLKRLNEYSIYYSSLQEAAEKTLMSIKDLQVAERCVRCINTHPFTEPFMSEGDPFNDEEERINQLKFTSYFNGVLIRCMFDRIIVDHKNKTIQPIDLKTTGKAESKFGIHSILDWSYYLQAGMYSQILLDVISKDEYFKDFTILPFKFAVVNRFKLKPQMWTYNLIQQGDLIIDPNEELLENAGYKSWRTLATEVIWHLETQQFDYSYDAYSHNGDQIINIKQCLNARK